MVVSTLSGSKGLRASSGDWKKLEIEQRVLLKDKNEKEKQMRKVDLMEKCKR